MSATFSPSYCVLSNLTCPDGKGHIRLRQRPSSTTTYHVTAIFPLNLGHMFLCPGACSSLVFSCLRCSSFDGAHVCHHHYSRLRLSCAFVGIREVFPPIFAVARANSVGTGYDARSLARIRLPWLGLQESATSPSHRSAIISSDTRISSREREDTPFCFHLQAFQSCANAKGYNLPTPQMLITVYQSILGQANKHAILFPQLALQSRTNVKGGDLEANSSEFFGSFRTSVPALLRMVGPEARSHCHLGPAPLRGPEQVSFGSQFRRRVPEPMPFWSRLRSESNILTFLRRIWHLGTEKIRRTVFFKKYPNGKMFGS